MRIKEEIEKLLKVFKKKKVMTLYELCLLFQCSFPTMRNYLKKWRAYTSCNNNGRYYVLPNVPTFNEYGIWNFNECVFSKHGNLKKTVMTLINNSISGFSAFELSEIIGMNAITFLSHFQKDLNFNREKHNGYFIYYSNEISIFNRQRESREKTIKEESRENLPSDGDAIVILVERIKYAKDSIDQLIHRIRRKGISISKDNVKNLFLHHGLLKKTANII